MQYLKKRGQISVYFMLGFAIILILIVILFIWTRVFRIEENVVVPQELSPVKNYIDFCVAKSSNTAFLILGRQGGFVNILPDMRANPARGITIAETEYVPFWYYNNRNYVPTLDFMETELAGFINDEFLTCIDEYELFQASFKIRKLADKSATSVKINDKGVAVEIDYPMELSTLDNSMKTKIKIFRQFYDVPVFRMVEFGKYILAYENTFFFLENITIGLMAMNPDIPFTGLLPECETRTWHIDNIKKSIQTSLFRTFPDIRVENTDYVPFQAPEEMYDDSYVQAARLRREIEEVPLFENFDEYNGYELAIDEKFKKYEDFFKNLPSDRYFYHNFMIPFSASNADTFQNYTVLFEYDPDYGMDIVAKPSKDGVLKSNNAKGMRQLLGAFCINTYHFTYDITYPVMISILDPYALNGDGYLFRFALPVLIRNNEGDRTKQHMESLPAYAVPDDFCLETGSKNPGRSSIIKVYDKSSLGRPALPGANISMICVKKKCPLGITERQGSTALLRFNLTQSCGNPILYAEKNGYFPTYYEVTDDYQDLFELEMVKLKNFTVNVMKHNYYPLDQSIGAAQLATEGTITVHLSGSVGELGLVDQPPTPHDEYFVLALDSSASINNANNMIQLPVDDSSYELSIVYLKNGEDYSGGYFGKWELTSEELRNGNSLEFHIVEMISSTLDEDAARSIAQLQNITSDQLKPRIINNNRIGV